MFGDALISLAQWSRRCTQSVQDFELAFMRILVDLDGLVMHFEKLYMRGQNPAHFLNRPRPLQFEVLNIS